MPNLNLRERLIDPSSPDRRPRRAAYALPTLFTAGNIYLGFVAITESLKGASAYSAEVKAGMYKPLGKGDAQIREVIQFLESIDYQGRLVLEQDVMLLGDSPYGTGPVEAVRESISFLHSIL